MSNLPSNIPNLEEKWRNMNKGMKRYSLLETLGTEFCISLLLCRAGDQPHASCKWGSAFLWPTFLALEVLIMILHAFTGEFIFHQSICGPSTHIVLDESFCSAAPSPCSFDYFLQKLSLFQSLFSLLTTYLRPRTVVSRQHRYLISQFSETILH